MTSNPSFSSQPPGSFKKPKDKWDRDLMAFKNKYANNPVLDNFRMDDQLGYMLVKKQTRKNYQSIYGGAPYEDPNGWHSHIKGGFGHERDNTFKSKKQQLDESGGYRWESMPEEDETTQAGGAIIEYANQWILSNIRVPPQFEFRSVVDGDMDTKKHNYECVLNVPGFPYASRKKAGTKVGAKLAATVDFIQYLVNNNHIDHDALPDFFHKKKVSGKDAPSNKDLISANLPDLKSKQVAPIDKQLEKQRKEMEKERRRKEKEDSFGWDKRSARFRLHKFCRENNISADIKVVAHGVEYNMMNEASIKFRYSGTLFQANVKHKNKKWSQNLASLEVVKQLCADGHIEKCDNIKKWQTLQDKSEIRMFEKVDHGGFSLETARPRLYRFLKDNKLFQQMIYTTFGNPPIERHIAEIKFTVRAKSKDGHEDALEINGRGEAPNKDLAERRCALHTIMQLHAFKLVNKLAEDREAEKQLAMGHVQSVRLGVDGNKPRKRLTNFKLTDSKFYKMAPLNIYKRQKKNDLFTCTFDSMKNEAKKYGYNPMNPSEQYAQDNKDHAAKLADEVKAISDHIYYLEPDADWIKYRNETLDDLDEAFKELKAADPNLISFQDVDVTPFNITVRDEFIVNRVFATLKRPTRDLLENYSKKLPTALEKVMSRRSFKNQVQTDIGFKESALRMNIIRHRKNDIPDANGKQNGENAESKDEETNSTTLIGPSKPTNNLAAEAVLTEEIAISNSDNHFVLYLEVVFTSPECSIKLLEVNGVDSMAPKPTGLGPAVSRFAVLPLLPSLAANRSLRRKTWFEHEIKKDANLNRDFSICVKIFRDLAYRWPNWQPLENWHIMQLVYIALKGIRWQIYNYEEHVMYTQKKKVFSIADNFRRCLELIATGYMLLNGPGIIDPCETGDVDIFNDLTIEMRNAVTLAAQTALRAMTYNKLAHYLSDPEALTGPDAMKFGYGDEGMSEQAKRQMEIDIMKYTGQTDVLAFGMMPREIESAPVVTADELLGGPEDVMTNTKKKDEVDDKIDDFMKDL